MSYETTKHILWPEKSYPRHKLDDEFDPVECELCDSGDEIHYNEKLNKYICINCEKEI